MNKREVIAFFDKCAPNWDENIVRSESKISYIMDVAGIKAGISVLDVACGTGVLFEDYLHRDVMKVTGVDISPEMARNAVLKLRDQRIEVLCGDIETIDIPYQYDCCVVYNAFPHFEDPARLIKRLISLLAPGGRLTVAHGMSLDALHRHHEGAAKHVSRPMLQTEELAKLMAPTLTVDMMVSDDEKYIVSGILDKQILTNIN